MTSIGVAKSSRSIRYGKRKKRHCLEMERSAAPAKADVRQAFRPQHFISDKTESRRVEATHRFILERANSQAASAPLARRRSLPPRLGKLETTSAKSSCQTCVLLPR